MRVLILLLLAWSPATFAKTAEEVMNEAREANRVDSSIQKVRMVIVSKGGSERSRELEMKARRDGEILKSYARFTSPSDVAGTQLLLIDNPEQVDEQLLYMPAIKRVNRISGKARKGSFMGSDFSYEDLELGGREGKHTLLEETADTWVIETVPGGDSSYGKIKAHVSKSDYVSRKIEFFDLEGAAIKVLEVKRTAEEGDVTLPVESVMRNLDKGTETRLEILEHRVGVPVEELPDEVFTQSYLERNG